MLPCAPGMRSNVAGVSVPGAVRSARMLPWPDAWSRPGTGRVLRDRRPRLGGDVRRLAGCLQNWTRSLPLRDRFWGMYGLLGLFEVLAVQAAAAASDVGALTLRAAQGGSARAPRGMDAQRLAGGHASWGPGGHEPSVQARPLTYWLSPVTDLPVAIALVVSASRRTHTWRGRPMTRANQTFVDGRYDGRDNHEAINFKAFLTAPRLLVLAHLIALGFGLGGLLIALPNPELWADSRAWPRHLRIRDGVRRLAAHHPRCRSRWPSSARGHRLGRGPPSSSSSPTASRSAPS